MRAQENWLLLILLLFIVILFLVLLGSLVSVFIFRIVPAQYVSLFITFFKSIDLAMVLYTFTIFILSLVLSYLTTRLHPAFFAFSILFVLFAVYLVHAMKTQAIAFLNETNATLVFPITTKTLENYEIIAFWAGLIGAIIGYGVSKI